MTTSPRKPLPIRITATMYVDAWQISELNDKILYMTDGSFIENVNAVTVNRSLIGISQLTKDYPALRKMGERLYIVPQNIRSLNVPETAGERGLVEMASGNQYVLPWTFTQDLLNSWAANSQHGMVHGAY